MPSQDRKRYQPFSAFMQVLDCGRFTVRLHQRNPMSAERKMSCKSKIEKTFRKLIQGRLRKAFADPAISKKFVLDCIIEYM
mmetsp:Transcript_28980/g.46707  ORF Transcript_28980/g.46707 Transcript_28980/m.46707 type:complete len:81 (+) Transcript_28980:240-482(+)